MSAADDSALSAQPQYTRPAPLTSPRSLRQLSLFLAGSSFFLLSTLITRRSLTRRYKASIPSYFTPSNRPPAQPVDGAVEAFEALSVASANVASLAVMGVGGVLWAADISGMEELRRKVRGGLGVDGSGRGEGDVEEEFEEWLATVLQRKEDKELRADGRRKGRPRTEDGRER
ncbi:MAG: hypothetical protein M1824_000724 [Vezdaea acicularis]|nr:MAG: hypothetical protein M1824_000724 [Vezdaea acicularis]